MSQQLHVALYFLLLQILSLHTRGNLVSLRLRLNRWGGCRYHDLFQGSSRPCWAARFLALLFFGVMTGIGLVGFRTVPLFSDQMAHHKQYYTILYYAFLLNVWWHTLSGWIFSLKLGDIVACMCWTRICHWIAVRGIFLQVLGVKHLSLWPPLKPTFTHDFSTSSWPECELTRVMRHTQVKYTPTGLSVVSLISCGSCLHTP